MLKVGLIGLGVMGRGHLENYIRLENEGYPVKLTAVCDIDPLRFGGEVKGNLPVGLGNFDFSPYNK